MNSFATKKEKNTSHWIHSLHYKRIISDGGLGRDWWLDALGVCRPNVYYNQLLQPTATAAAAAVGYRHIQSI